MNDTQGVIVGLLEAGYTTGGEIYKKAEVELGEFFSTTRSQIYRELHALAATDQVRTVGKLGPRNSVRFKATAKGRKAYRAWLAKDGKVLIRDGVRVREHLAAAPVVAA